MASNENSKGEIACGEFIPKMFKESISTHRRSHFGRRSKGVTFQKRLFYYVIWSSVIGNYDTNKQ